jgi:alkylphosphonate utilization operon protein PhnA
MSKQTRPLCERDDLPKHSEKWECSSQVLKVGAKSKPIRLVEGDHEIDCRMDGMSIALKAQFVKKVGP